MTNDTSTLNGSLLEMKDQLIYELAQKGVTANYDSSTGLLGLIDKIEDIEQGGGGPEIVSFDNLTTEFNYTQKRGNYGFSVTIPNGVTSLGDNCFNGCTGLTNVDIPSGVTSLGSYCFKGCTGLTNIVIPSGVTRLGSDCFYNCTGLTNVDIPSGVTSLGSYCFKGCTGLTSIVIPSSVTSIGNHCFRDCTGLTSIAIPSSVTSIGDNCFRNCNGLTSIVIPSSVTNLQTGCFSQCSGLTSIVIPSGVTSLDDACFDGCSGLTNIVIPSGVTRLGSDCFKDCTGLTSIVIPSSVTSLGIRCFQGCTGLTSVVIPSSVTSLGLYCFWYCTNLVDYQLYWETPPVTWDSTLMSNHADTYFTIPNGTTANYTAKGFPSDKLVEAIFTDCGVTNNSNLIQWFYSPTFSSASVDETGTTFTALRDGSYATVSATLTQNPTSTDIYPYSFPLTVEFDLIGWEDNQGATSSYARIRVYNNANNKIAYWNFTDFGVGHYKIVCTEGSQKLYYNGVEQSRKFTFTPTSNWNVAFQTRGNIKFKNFRIYHMPWESNIQLTATNPYLMSGETTDVVVELENGLGNPLTNRNVTIEQSVFIDDGTTASHNESWSVTNGTMTRESTYTRLVESAQTLMCQMNKGYITPTSTVEFDFKAVDGVKNWGLIYIRNSAGGNSLTDLSLNQIGGEIGEWIHLKIVFNNTDTITIYSSKLDNPITRTLSSTDSNYRLLLYGGGVNTELHFKNVVVYETINGVTDENGEFALYDISDDTIFTATYGTVSDTCTVEKCRFVDYAVKDKHNHNYFNQAGTSKVTITEADSYKEFKTISTTAGNVYIGSSTSLTDFDVGDTWTIIWDKLYIDGYNVAFQCYNGSTTVGINSMTLGLHNSDFQELKFVCDGSSIKAYVDGVYKAQTSYTPTGHGYLRINLNNNNGTSQVTFRAKNIRIRKG